MKKKKTEGTLCFFSWTPAGQQEVSNVHNSLLYSSDLTLT